MLFIQRTARLHKKGLTKTSKQMNEYPDWVPKSKPFYYIHKYYQYLQINWIISRIFSPRKQTAYYRKHRQIDQILHLINQHYKCTTEKPMKIANKTTQLEHDGICAAAARDPHEPIHGLPWHVLEQPVLKQREGGSSARSHHRWRHHHLQC